MKTTRLTAILVFCVTVILTSGCASGVTRDNGRASVIEPSSPSPSVEKAEKIEVVHFHGTNQCYSCITVGKYALNTIKERFPKEYADGTIVFRDINGELSENQDIVMKYQARGSSLFINAIRNGSDNIEEDTKVWRLISDETQYADYLEDKLNKLLGK